MEEVPDEENRPSRDIVYDKKVFNNKGNTLIIVVERLGVHQLTVK